jgi:hypothetical protein
MPLENSSSSGVNHDDHQDNPHDDHIIFTVQATVLVKLKALLILTDEFANYFACVNTT